MPGFAIAILKVLAWVNLLFGVGLAMAISLSHPVASGAAGGPAAWYAFPEYVRVVLELACAFEGFSGWALMLTVATIADQLEQLQASVSRNAQS